MPNTPHSSLNLSSMGHHSVHAAVRLKKDSRAVAQICSASLTVTSMVFCPAMEIASRDPPVVPMRRAGTPAALAYTRTSFSLDGLTETTIREALSPKRAGIDGSGEGVEGSDEAASSTVAPMPPVSKQHSARVTAMPPSE